MPAQKVAGDPHHEPEQKRDAPAPGVQGFGRHGCRESRAHGRAEQDAACGPAWRQRTYQTAAALRRALDQEHHRACVFAADGKSLHHAQEGERDRRRHADGRVAWQQPDQEGRYCHPHDREGERRTASESVADMTDEGAAYRPHQITDGKHAKGRKKLGDRIPVREKVASDRSCEVAVDREIVPFEHVADHAGSNRLILRRRNSCHRSADCSRRG